MLSRVENTLPPLGFAHFQAVIRDIVAEGKYQNLILSGAEVTVFDRLEEYVQFAASLGWFKKIQIQTNGRRLKDKNYADKLIRSGVNEFFVSIQGMRECHDATTGVPGSFPEAVTGLRNAAEEGANVITNTVLTQRSLNDIIPLFEFLAKESVSELQLWNFFPMEGTDTGDRIVPIESFRQLLPDLAALATEAGKPVVLKSFPQCLSPGPPLFFDSHFPATVLPDQFWEQFRECGFGQCFYRKTKQCGSGHCWGFSTAYLNKYGDERMLLSPVDADTELSVEDE